ncbi:YcaO-like family protein [Streptococcus orisasini]|uniref:YcaO-like family protein n=1 Tax=Streptococcus orisasini TaxID=1080071 RepID=UPI00070F2A1F|nr:YcaO-like family protein [Streptococcus orisasini]
MEKVVEFQFENYIVVCYEKYQNSILDFLNQNRDYSMDYGDFDSLKFKNISKVLIQELKKLSDKYFFLIDMFTGQVSKLIVYWEYRDYFEEIFLREIEDDYFINEGYRSKKFSELIQVLERNSDILFHPELGVCKKSFRNHATVYPLISQIYQSNGKNFDSHGRSSTLNSAFYLAVLEGLERIHGAYSMDKEIYSKKSELVLPYIDLKELSKYSINNNVSADFDEKIHWRRGFDLISNEQLYLPVQGINFGPPKDEKRFIESNSNGMAIGTNIIEAIIGGIFEILERDAFLTYWFTLSKPKVINEIVDNDINKLIHEIYLKGYKVTIFDIRTEVDIPIVWILFTQIKGNNVVNNYVSASCGISYKDAILSALVEGIGSLEAFNEFYIEKKLQIPLSRDMIYSVEDHVLFYSSEEKLYEFDFALKDQENILWQDIKDVNILENIKTQKDLLADLISRLLKNFPDIQVIVTINHSELLSALHLRSVKVSIPQLQNISFGEENKNINIPRLRKFSTFKGRELIINDKPHPFP